jgi:hypothetical protein
VLSRREFERRIGSRGCFVCVCVCVEFCGGNGDDDDDGSVQSGDM